jgi:hypothetical protein
MSLPLFKPGKTGHRVLNALVALLAPLAAPTFTDLHTVTGNRKVSPSAAAANIVTAGAGTYTAAQLAGGVITRDPTGADRTDTTDTAANLITALGLTADYQERDCLIVNTADAAETITLAGGAGVTLLTATTIPQGGAIRLSFIRTGAAAVSARRV